MSEHNGKSRKGVCGPKPMAGKAVVRLNPVRHGVLAQTPVIPLVERREDWAEVVERYSGLRSSSDRLRELDEWGLETTRRLLLPGLTDPFVP